MNDVNISSEMRSSIMLYRILYIPSTFAWKLSPDRQKSPQTFKLHVMLTRFLQSVLPAHPQTASFPETQHRSRSPRSARWTFSHFAHSSGSKVGPHFPSRFASHPALPPSGNSSVCSAPKEPFSVERSSSSFDLPFITHGLWDVSDVGRDLPPCLLTPWPRRSTLP